MNKKNDEILMTLLKAKENIATYNKEKVKNKNWQPYYNNVVEEIDNIIADYTITTKMSDEEIMSCLFELGADDKNSIFYEDYMNIKINL